MRLPVGGRHRGCVRGRLVKRRRSLSSTMLAQACEIDLLNLVPLALAVVIKRSQIPFP